MPEGPILYKANCRYVGSVPVKMSTGIDLARASFGRVEELHAAAKSVKIWVTPHGVTMDSAKEGETLKEVDINNVSFVATKTGDNSTFCFFEVDDPRHLKSCHVLTLGKGNADPFGDAVDEAIELREQMDAEQFTRQGSFADNGGISRTASVQYAQGGGGGSKKFGRKSSVKYMGKNDGKMGDIAEGGDSGELRNSYEGTFYGKMSVEKSTGDETADEAQRLILKSPTPLPGVLRLYDNVIELYNQVDDLAYHHSAITNCTFAKYYPSLDVFVYILKDNSADTLEAWVIGVPAQVEGQKSIRREIDELVEAHTAKNEKAKKASKKGDKGAKSGKKKKKKAAKKSSVKTSNFDCFEGALLGSVTVGQGQNQTTCTKCVQILAEHNAEPDGIFLQLEVHGIRMYEALTHDPWGSYPKKQIIYCTVAGPKKDHVCFTTSDVHLGTKTCNVLRCTNAPRANQMFAALKKFGVNTEEVEGAANDPAQSKAEEFGGFEEEMEDPFTGEGERIEAPGNLFKRQIRRGTLKAVKAVGAGQFGEVYLAKMTNAEEGTVIDCAVKMLKDVKSQSDRDEFVHEAEVMLETAHVNVMGMLGVAVQQKPWLMVLDFMRYGDLQALVKAAPPKGIIITHQEMLTLSAGICNGMKYMESIGFAHCDLAARNILVADENVVKVADFGLTRRLRHRPRWVGPKMMKIPIRWSAVEILDGREFSLKSDVWAFGITVWEVFSYGLTPYPTLRNAEVHRTLIAGGRIGMPPAMNKKVFEVVKACFKKSPDARPTFKELSDSFAIFMREGAMDAPVRDIGQTIKDANPIPGGNQKPTGPAGKGKKTAEEEETYYYSKGR